MNCNTTHYRANSSSVPGDPTQETTPAQDSPRSALLERRQKQLDETRASARWMGRTHSILFAAKTLLPKTDETKTLLQRKLFSAADIKDMRDREDSPPPMGMPGDDVRLNERDVQHRIEDIILRRSAGWVVGTSLLFEAVVVGLAALVFCRRDF